MKPDAAQRLEIRKYPNRRFYDQTRSVHVTLTELHALICEGYELHIVDSQSGQDITNVVLMQILLERDPPKLDVFPAGILHAFIRTQQNLLGSVVEDFFRQVLATHRQSQERWLQFLQNTFGQGAPGMPASPFDWSRGFFEAFMPSGAAPRTGSAPKGAAAAPADEPAAAPEQPPPTATERPDSPTSDPRAKRDAELDALRRQLEAMQNSLDQLQASDSRTAAP